MTAAWSLPGRRSSPGGSVVSSSLATLGLHQRPSVALVETAVPRARGFDLVLCQNAWNFLAWGEMRPLLRDYTPRMAALYLARRPVAAFNTRRAGRVLALSTYMGDLLRGRGLDPIVSPVTLPLDLCSRTSLEQTPLPCVPERFVLVPGTLTPYKAADYAVELLGLLEPEERPFLVLAGPDDGSGHRQRVEERARRLGLRHWIGAVNRSEMAWLLESAATTLVPSRLESLSFSLAEALVLSPRVAASPLPVHREVAHRISRQPLWLPARPDLATARRLVEEPPATSLPDRRVHAQEWTQLAALLGAIPNAA